ncbi:MAG: cytochrome c family protein [Pseudomonadota bacterium]
MDTPNFNTIAMGFLFTLFIVLGLNFVSELAFHPEAPEVSGYQIEVAETASAAAEDAPEEEPIGVLLASADIGAGEKLIKRCVACHSFEDGGANKVGPQLWDIVNRDMGAVSSFGYSGALEEYGAGKQWTYEELDGFLKKPNAWIKGTAMGFAGLKKPDDRANIIAYMRTLSANPAPLPAQ